MAVGQARIAFTRVFGGAEWTRTATEDALLRLCDRDLRGRLPIDGHGIHCADDISAGRRGIRRGRRRRERSGGRGRHQGWWRETSVGRMSGRALDRRFVALVALRGARRSGY
jgi:hypothetical protein